MYENIVLTTAENEDKASSFVQQYSGVVVTSCAVSSEDIGGSTTATTHTMYGLKITEGYGEYESGEENYSTTSNYSVIENALLQNGVMVNPEVYVISSDSAFSNEYEMLYKSAEILNRIPYFNVWIIEEDGHSKFLPKS